MAVNNSRGIILFFCFYISVRPLNSLIVVSSVSSKTEQCLLTRTMLRSVRFPQKFSKNITGNTCSGLSASQRNTWSKHHQSLFLGDYGEREACLERKQCVSLGKKGHLDD